MPENNSDRKTDMEVLKAKRAAILRATNADEMMKEVVELDMALKLLKGKYGHEVDATVERTLNEIKAFWMHDKTRADVCRLVQTIICKLNTMEE